MVVIERFRKTGEQYAPHRYGDGYFRVADSRLGAAKKLQQNQIPVASLEDVIGFVRRGYHLRMSGEINKQPSRICPEEIIIR